MQGKYMNLYAKLQDFKQSVVYSSNFLLGCNCKFRKGTIKINSFSMLDLLKMRKNMAGKGARNSTISGHVEQTSLRYSI